MSRFRADVAGRALLGLGLVELALARSDRSLVDAAGRVMVDTTPLPLVETTIRFVGTTDKPLLRASVLAGAATTAGLLPSVLGRGARGRAGLGTALAAAGGVAAYSAARRRLTALRTAQDEARRAVTVPDPLPVLVDGAETWPHVEPLVTPVEDFYATDVNLRPPLLDRDTWRLELDAPAGRAAVGLDQLMAMELRERDALLACVHNRLGWDRLGHQRWTGISVAALFAATGIALPDTGAHDVVMEAVDGFRQVMPLREVIERDAWVVVGMGGRELPTANGFPARVMTPGVVGQYNGVKWLTKLAVVSSGEVTATWVQRGWPRPTIEPRLTARIDHPGPVGMPPRLPTGRTGVAARTAVVGTAWAPANGGVVGVDVSVDGGAWQPAELAADLGPASWRRWRTELDLTPGPHEIAARCTAHDGTVQIGEPSHPFPDGTTGHHTVGVQVGAGEQ